MGPTSLIGREVREQLAGAGCPGELIDLLDVDEEVGVLTDYGDEARVILEAAEGRLRGASLVCFCGDPEAARRLAPAALQGGGTVIDCTSAYADDSAAMLVGDATDAGAEGLFVVPEAATLVLRDLMTAVAEFEASAAATVLLPASVGDDGAPDQLARQAAALLNFNEPDAEELGRRQAFDVVPATPALAARIRSQLEALGVAPPRLSCFRASVFHGIAVSLSLPSVTASAVTEGLAAADLEVGRVDENGTMIDSPGRVAGSTGVFVATVTDDPAGGCWVWAVADNHHATARAAAGAIMAHLVPVDPASSD